MGFEDTFVGGLDYKDPRGGKHAGYSICCNAPIFTLTGKCSKCGTRANTEDCDGYQVSCCCNATYHNESDICGACGEHMDTMCADCDDRCIDYEVKY